MSAELLEADGLSMRFGGLTAIDNLSFKARAGEITAIIGPNGAGKTTVFNCLTGFYRPSGGEIRLSHNGKNLRLDRMEGYAIARKAKVVRTFQNVRLFAGMSVLENLMIAQHVELMRASLYSLAGLLDLTRHRDAERAAVDRARYWLELVGLADAANEVAGGLSYGSQRRLEIARAMCAGPILLCVDEPAAGLNPHESHELSRLLLEIKRNHGVSILLIEHDMSVVMHISDRVIVLDHGACIAQGTPSEVRGNPAVIRAYLGATDEAGDP